MEGRHSCRLAWKYKVFKELRDFSEKLNSVFLFSHFTLCYSAGVYLYTTTIVDLFVPSEMTRSTVISAASFWAAASSTVRWSWICFWSPS